MPARKDDRPQPVQTILRLPPALHEALKARAEAEGVSLNTLMLVLLAGGVAFEADE